MQYGDYDYGIKNEMDHTYFSYVNHPLVFVTITMFLKNKVINGKHLSKSLKGKENLLFVSIRPMSSHYVCNFNNTYDTVYHESITIFIQKLVVYVRVILEWQKSCLVYLKETSSNKIPTERTDTIVQNLKVLNNDTVILNLFYR